MNVYFLDFSHLHFALFGQSENSKVALIGPKSEFVCPENAPWHFDLILENSSKIQMSTHDWGVDVSDSFILAYTDEGSILGQIYDEQIFSAFYFEDLIFWQWFKKMHI